MGLRNQLDETARKAGARIPYTYFLIVTVALTYVVMIMGSYTSAIGAGLSCPDWPKCYGVWIPFDDPEAMYEHPEFPGYAEAYTTWQIFVEWAHRGLAAILGVMMLAATAGGWLGREKPRAVAWGVTFALAFMPFQVVLGGLTVTRRLDPVIVTLHLATATLIIVSLTVATTASWYHRRSTER